MKGRKLAWMLLCVLSGYVCANAAWQDDITTEEDEEQTDVRENPNIGGEEVHEPYVRTIDVPSYVNEEANRIEMNGDDWTELAKVFADAKNRTVSVVHIGDSHLQADVATGVVRKHLTEYFGSSNGRGLVVPFRLAGTNEPYDYSFTSRAIFTTSKLLKKPWATAMRFTGIGIKPAAATFEIAITAREEFDALNVYFSGSDLRLNSANVSGENMTFVTFAEEGLLKVILTEKTLNISLKMSGKGVTIHGVNLIDGNVGLSYHVIGNNGATFASYSGIDNVGEDVSTLNPDLIILSLGTNEAFGRLSTGILRSQIDALVTELRLANPTSHILLTTPQECQRRTSRRRRRKKTYAVNTNVKAARDVILQYGKDNGIAVYDWYAVAGGTYSSSKWIGDKFFNTDRIHLTIAGYTLQGNLMAEALINALTTQQ